MLESCKACSLLETPLVCRAHLVSLNPLKLPVATYIISAAGVASARHRKYETARGSTSVLAPMPAGSRRAEEVSPHGHHPNKATVSQSATSHPNMVEGCRLPPLPLAHSRTQVQAAKAPLIWAQAGSCRCNIAAGAGAAAVHGRRGGTHVPSRRGRQPTLQSPPPGHR